MSTGTPPNPDDGSPPNSRKLTPELIAGVVTVIMAGNFRSTAAARMRIGDRTFKRWMQLGKKFPDGLYGTFRRCVLEAEAAAEIKAVGAILAAGQDDAKHLEWWLERKLPQRWGKCRGELVELRRQVEELKRMLADIGPQDDARSPRPR